MKRPIPTIMQKRAISSAIIDVFNTRKSFLILGHKSPDEDCISSTVAAGILLSKIDRPAVIFQSHAIHEHFEYLVSISRYNGIAIVSSSAAIPDDIDAVIICDTPKGSMLDTIPEIDLILNDESVVKVEIDHHIGADSEYIGDPELSLVTEASSASELVGYLALKMKSSPWYAAGGINPFTRNFVLAVLTGIIGDSKMGSFLKSRRERIYYSIFSEMYNRILGMETTKKTNLSDMSEVFSEIQKLSSEESMCAEMMRRDERKHGLFSYVIVDRDISNEIFRRFGSDTVVSVARGLADDLAEKSGRLGLIAYYDPDETTGLIQFRIRRSMNYKVFDLRRILEKLDIDNGGGHEGAIGFRVEKDRVSSIHSFAIEIMDAAGSYA